MPETLLRKSAEIDVLILDYIDNPTCENYILLETKRAELDILARYYFEERS